MPAPYVDIRLGVQRGLRYRLSASNDAEEIHSPELTFFVDADGRA
jgi:hypothetical protein